MNASRTVLMYIVLGIIGMFSIPDQVQAAPAIITAPTAALPTLQAAYGVIPSGGGVIQVSGAITIPANSGTNDFIADLATEVVISGGYDSQFQTRSGVSTVAGSVIIRSGQLIIDGVSIGNPSLTESHTIGIVISSAVGAGESFTFSLGGNQQISIAQSGVVSNFPLKLARGTSYTASQTVGPRTCNFTSSNHVGTVGTADIVVSANCGSPPAPLPTITSFTAAQTLLSPGGGTEITPVFINGNGEISPGIGAVSSGIAVSVTPNASTVYTLTVSDAAGNSSSKSLAIFMQKPFQLVSLSDRNVPADYLTYLARAMVTPDGRNVVFASMDDTLSAGDANHASDIYLRDLVNGTTSRMSFAPDGSQSNGNSDNPKVSDDGCLMVFESNANNLVPGYPTRIYTDIYLTNRCSFPQNITMVSIDNAGIPGSGSSRTADISADGRYVVFASDARLTAEYPINTSVYLRDLQTNSTMLISRNANGSWASGTNPIISADGTKVIYESLTDILGLGATAWQLYAFDIASAVTTLVSSSETGVLREQGNESGSRAIRASVSRDGRYVTFCTTAGNLTAATTNGFQNVFVKDTQTGSIRLLSQNAGGAPGNGDSVRSQGGRAAISGNGGSVSFNTGASNLVGGQYSTMVINYVTGQTDLLHPGSVTIGDTDPFLSQDLYGRFVLIKAGEALDTNYPGRGIFLKDRHVAPLAVAGPAQTVAPGATVTLDGSESSFAQNIFMPSQTVLKYAWSQISGPAINFLPYSDPARRSFVPGQVGIYIFRLTVNDNFEDSLADHVTVTVQ